MLDFLRDEGVSPQIIAEVEAFRAKYPVGERLAARVPVSRYLYYGKDVWEEALTALLCAWQKAPLRFDGGMLAVYAALAALLMLTYWHPVHRSLKRVLRPL